MTKLFELAKIESDNEGKQKDIFKIPEGDTLVNLDKVDLERRELSDQNGKKRTTWVLDCGDGRKFWAGYKVYSGLIEAQKKGFKQGRITRAGTTSTNTVYIVVGY